MHEPDTDILVLEPADYRVMPWKNGGGTTREIFVHPQGAAAFDFRLSIADVSSDGPFSSFAGYARTIMLLDGNGMRLVFDNETSATIDTRFKPVDFDGGANTFCSLLNGPVRDFNIMSARDRVTHRHHIVEHFPFVPSASNARMIAVFCLHDKISVALAGLAPQRLSKESMLLLKGTAVTRIEEIDGERKARALLIEVLPLDNATTIKKT